jgi:Stress responsive A/B Barrel Domain
MQSFSKLIKVTLLFVLVASSTYAQKGKKSGLKISHKTEKLLRHVVIFKFKDTSSPEDVQKVADTFYALKGQVPEIAAMEWGINNSPENFNQGFTHCFVLSYHSEKDLANYQENPAHRAFQEVLKPHMEKVFVVDYWMK